MSFAGVSQVFRTGNFRISAYNIDCYQLVNLKVFRVRNICRALFFKKSVRNGQFFLVLWSVGSGKTE